MPNPVAELAKAEPNSAPILAVLTERHIIGDSFCQNGATIADTLLTIIRSPRYSGISPRHVYWSLLERLYNPYSSTQRTNLPFENGSLSTMTCVSAARILRMIAQFPSEYARIVESLTSPAGRFSTVRQYEPARYDRKLIWLSGAFPVEELGDHCLRILVSGDGNAHHRAIAEHNARKFPEYDFGVRAESNTRLLTDVLIQSALTNYGLRGEYDSNRDCDRTTGKRGVARGTFGYESLDEDVLLQHHPDNPRNKLPKADPNKTVKLDPRWGVPIYESEEDSIEASKFSYTQGIYLSEPMLAEIDD